MGPEPVYGLTICPHRDSVTSGENPASSNLNDGITADDKNLSIFLRVICGDTQRSSVRSSSRHNGVGHGDIAGRGDKSAALHSGLGVAGDVAARHVQYMGLILCHVYILSSMS